MTEAEEMQELLTYASNAKVARALGVSPTAVGNWAKGEKINPRRLQQVRDLLRPQTKEAVPRWAERLLAGVMALEGKAPISVDELADAEARAAAFLAASPHKRRGPDGGGDPAEEAA